MMLEVFMDGHNREIIRAWDEINQQWVEYYFKEWRDGAPVYSRVVEGEVVKPNPMLSVVDDAKL